VAAPFMVRVNAARILRRLKPAATGDYRDCFETSSLALIRGSPSIYDIFDGQQGGGPCPKGWARACRYC